MKNRIFSTDSAKAVKAQSYGYLNAIQYLAPFDLSGHNVCPKASDGCRKLCLGWFSGQASMVKSEAIEHRNSVRLSRVQKTQRFMRNRQAYLADVVRSIELLQAKAKRKGVKLCVRLNGSSDIAWEGIRYNGRNLFEQFSTVQFVDYTKIASRFRRKLPANYSLTFSRSERNEPECRKLLESGHNVAIVFAGDKPTTLWGFKVIDGDKHDLRHLDPQGVIIGLSPKGPKAKRDQSGFVMRI